MTDRPLSLDCRPEGDGWTCTVTVGDDPGRTRHVVTVRRGDLDRLVPGGVDASELVRASFAFLLEREPRESILRSFELPVIERYFPDYPSVIAGRLSARR
jgi:hypothetical protein